MTSTMKSIYKPSNDIVAREIEGEIIIVPLVSGIGDLDDELFTLNETGKAIWKQLDGSTTLGNIVENLEKEYYSSREQIKNDVFGLIGEMKKRRIIIEV